MTRKNCLKKTDDRRHRGGLAKARMMLDEDDAGASGNAFRTSAEIVYALAKATKSLLCSLVRSANGRRSSRFKRRKRDNRSTALPMRVMNAKF